MMKTMMIRTMGQEKERMGERKRGKLITINWEHTRPTLWSYADNTADENYYDDYDYDYDNDDDNDKDVEDDEDNGEFINGELCHHHKHLEKIPQFCSHL